MLGLRVQGLVSWDKGLWFRLQGLGYRAIRLLGSELGSRYDSDGSIWGL